MYYTRRARRERVDHQIAVASSNCYKLTHEDKLKTMAARLSWISYCVYVAALLVRISEGQEYNYIAASSPIIVLAYKLISPMQAL